MQLEQSTLPSLAGPPKKSSRLARAFAAIGIAIALATSGLAAAAPADAAAFSYGVYSPNKLDKWNMDAWANLSRDCSGTYGCYNYMKIEKKHWWGWSEVAGKWANANGWNSIKANIDGGCLTYRLTVNSYNDVAGGYGSGANVGSAGYSSNGTKIDRYMTTWSSGERRICRG